MNENKISITESNLQENQYLEELVIKRTKELYETNKQLQHQATHDFLTNIPNRYTLEKALKDSVLNAKEHNSMGALLFVDIDNFKVINDIFGHDIGDELLCKMASITMDYFKSTKYKHLISRLGGDEFAILLYDIDIYKAQMLAENYRYLFDGHEINLNSEMNLNTTISIGCVKIDGELTPKEILSFADTALYSAKDNGKNRVGTIKSYDDKKTFSQANKMVNTIKNALKENKFTLYYQPIKKNNNGITHYEALIRMLDENNNLIYPSGFIPIAERFGLMSQIDKWVIKNVIKTLEEHTSMIIFLNISGTSLGDKALLQYTENAIKNSKIEPAHIGFEITETTAIKDLIQSENWINKLKQLGCRFALDDFGVGFSSFSYLGSLPIDYLKIDGSFVRNLDKNPKQIALIQAMNAVAHLLNKETIAECVENEETFRILKDLKIDYSQGYFIGKPEPIKKGE